MGQREGKKVRGLPAIADWFGVEPFSTFEGSVWRSRRETAELRLSRGGCTGLITDFTVTSSARKMNQRRMREK